MGVNPEPDNILPLGWCSQPPSSTTRPRSYPSSPRLSSPLLSSRMRGPIFPSHTRHSLNPTRYFREKTVPLNIPRCSRERKPLHNRHSGGGRNPESHPRQHSPRRGGFQTRLLLLTFTPSIVGSTLVVARFPTLLLFLRRKPAPREGGGRNPLSTHVGLSPIATQLPPPLSSRKRGPIFLPSPISPRYRARNLYGRFANRPSPAPHTPRPRQIVTPGPSSSSPLRRQGPTAGHRRDRSPSPSRRGDPWSLFHK